MEEGRGFEGVWCIEIEQRSEGREDGPVTQEETSVAETPEILRMVMKVPAGAGENFTGGQIDKQGLDGAVVIFGRIVRDALYKATGAEGKQDVGVVDQVEREHGRADALEAGGKTGKAEISQGDTQSWLGTSCPGRADGQCGP